MDNFLSSASSQVYRHAAKPLLFKASPDSVHEWLIKTGKVVQSVGFLRDLLRYSWAYENPKMLKQKINGVRFYNPVGLSAGFDANFELAPLMKAVGFGFMEGGSLTYKYCAGNPKPWFYRLPNSKSIVVNKGLANNGVDAILHRISKYPSSTFRKFPLNISVAKTNSKESGTDAGAVADYIGSLKAIKQSGLGDIVTLNISCPNAYGGEPFITPGRLAALLDEVDKVGLERPVFIKMPNHLPWSEFHKLVKVADAHNIQGLTISNLAKDRASAKLKDPLNNKVKGNLSGKPTWQASNDLIRNTYRNYGKRFTIIGVGGIFSAEDAYAKIKFGASLVEVITGVIFEGPQLIGQINKGLAQLLEQDGYSNISQAIGKDA